MTRVKRLASIALALIVIAASGTTPVRAQTLQELSDRIGRLEEQVKAMDNVLRQLLPKTEAAPKPVASPPEAAAVQKSVDRETEVHDTARVMPAAPLSPSEPVSLAAAVSEQDCPKPALRLERTPLVICFHKGWKVPLWVGYEVSEATLTGNQARTDDFRPDPQLQPEEQASLNDYRGSGYDRGHMAPAATFRVSAQTMSNTFIMTNMAPQTPLLNRGVWVGIEQFVRDLARSTGPLWVFTGNAFFNEEQRPITAMVANDNERMRPTVLIGEGKVAVPSASFKVILYVDKKTHAPQMLAIMVPNWHGGLSRDPRSYLTSVRSIETATGIDFFGFLPKAVQDDLEPVIAPWPSTE